jgi:predicted PurR-regulated permease PerM
VANGIEDGEPRPRSSGWRRSDAVILLAGGVLLVAAWALREVLLLLFAAVLLGVVLRRTALAVHRATALPERVSLATVVLLVASGLFTAFAWQGPRIAEEVTVLREQLPQALEQLRSRLASYEAARQLVESLPSPREILGDGEQVMERAGTAASTTFGALAAVGLWLFVAVLLAAAPRSYVRGVVALVPSHRVPQACRLLSRLGDTLWWWALGRLMSMTFLGVVTGIGLWLLDVPLAFLLAVIAALLSFIPNIGPVISAVPAVLIALAADPTKALWVVALYVGVQAVESLLLDPLIDRRTVYLPPALTVAAQLALGTLVGLLGVALAAPLTAAAMVVVSALWVHGRLGKPEPPGAPA